MSSIKLTVFFEDPFWVGVFERQDETDYEVAKVTFGTEPKVEEVKNFILKNYYKIPFSRTTKTEKAVNSKINPKRLQRKVKNELTTEGVGTKAQVAIKQAIEERKQERKTLTKTQKEENEKERFTQKQSKKKEKKKGH